MPEQYLAHSANELGEVDLLKDHLTNVAKLASRVRPFSWVRRRSVASGNPP